MTQHMNFQEPHLPVGPRKNGVAPLRNFQKMHTPNFSAAEHEVDLSVFSVNAWQDIITSRTTTATHHECGRGDEEAAEEQDLGRTSSLFDSRNMAQRWLDRRMAGLTTEDMGPLCIYTTTGLSPPSALDSIWMHCQIEHPTSHYQLTSGEIESLLACEGPLCIISNPFNDAELALLMKFVEAIDVELGDLAPPLLMIPHTIAPEVRPEYAQLDVQKHDFIKALMGVGIDGIIADEPMGLRLILAIDAQKRKCEHISNRINQLVTDRIERRELAARLQTSIEITLWEYLRDRIAKSIPPLDPKLPSGEPQELAGFNVGQCLGRGSCGSVRKLLPVGDDVENDSQGRVVKLVAKSLVKDVSDLKDMQRSIDVMWYVSSRERRHVNLVQLHQVFHSDTHIMYVMDDGGSENLARRLAHRAHADVRKRRPIPLPEVWSMMSQAVTVIQHIHSLGVCHRDIKPENFMASTKEDGSACLKLVDFDLALRVSPGHMCACSCGTFGFIAPEVLLEKRYDGKKCDIWSLSIVLLELLCGIRLMEKVFPLQDTIPARQQTELPHRRHRLKHIRAHFGQRGAVGRLISEYHLRELRPLCSYMLGTLNGMLQIDPQERWDADQVAASMAENESVSGNLTTKSFQDLLMPIKC